MAKNEWAFDATGVKDKWICPYCGHLNEIGMNLLGGQKTKHVTCQQCDDRDSLLEPSDKACV